MNEIILTLIAKIAAELGLNYAFLRWNGEPVYPYFVGEYTDAGEAAENGRSSVSFLLTGFTRGSWLELETVKTAIINKLRCYTGLFEGYGYAITYSNSAPVPEEDEELKAIQIYLDVNVWRAE